MKKIRAITIRKYYIIFAFLAILILCNFCVKKLDPNLIGIWLSYSTGDSTNDSNSNSPTYYYEFTIDGKFKLIDFHKCFQDDIIA